MIMINKEKQRFESELGKKFYQILYPNNELRTGFFCEIPIPKKKERIKVLLTTYSNLGDEDVEKGVDIKIFSSDDKNNGKIVKKEYCQIIFHDEVCNVTMIEIFNNSDILRSINYLEYSEEYEDYSTKSVYLVDFSSDKKLIYPIGLILKDEGKMEGDDENENKIKYFCFYKGKSFGGPIIYDENVQNLKNKIEANGKNETKQEKEKNGEKKIKVIGIHYGNNNKEGKYWNLGLYILDIISSYYGKNGWRFISKKKKKEKQNNNNQMNINNQNNNINNQQNKLNTCYLPNSNQVQINNMNPSQNNMNSPLALMNYNSYSHKNNCPQNDLIISKNNSDNAQNSNYMNYLQNNMNQGQNNMNYPQNNLGPNQNNMNQSENNMNYPQNNMNQGQHNMNSIQNNMGSMQNNINQGQNNIGQNQNNMNYPQNNMNYYQNNMNQNQNNLNMGSIQNNMNNPQYNMGSIQNNMNQGQNNMNYPQNNMYPNQNNMNQKQNINNPNYNNSMNQNQIMSNTQFNNYNNNMSMGINMNNQMPQNQNSNPTINSMSIQNDMNNMPSNYNNMNMNANNINPNNNFNSINYNMNINAESNNNKINIPQQNNVVPVQNNMIPGLNNIIPVQNNMIPAQTNMVLVQHNMFQEQNNMNQGQNNSNPSNKINLANNQNYNSNNISITKQNEQITNEIGINNNSIQNNIINENINNTQNEKNNIQPDNKISEQNTNSNDNQYNKNNVQNDLTSNQNQINHNDNKSINTQSGNNNKNDSNRLNQPSNINNLDNNENAESIKQNENISTKKVVIDNNKNGESNKGDKINNEVKQANIIGETGNNNNINNKINGNKENEEKKLNEIKTNNKIKEFIDIYSNIDGEKINIIFTMPNNEKKGLKIPSNFTNKELYYTAYYLLKKKENEEFEYDNLLKLFLNKILLNNDDSIEILKNNDKIEIKQYEILSCLDFSDLIKESKSKIKKAFSFKDINDQSINIGLPDDITITEMIDHINSIYNNFFDSNRVTCEICFNNKILEKKNKHIKEVNRFRKLKDDHIDIIIKIKNKVCLKKKPGSIFKVKIFENHNKNKPISEIPFGTLEKIKEFYEDLKHELTKKKKKIENFAPSFEIEGQKLDLDKTDERTFFSIKVKNDFICILNSLTKRKSHIFG